MKKIIIFLILAYSYAFSVTLTQEEFSSKLGTGKYIFVSAVSAIGGQFSSGSNATYYYEENYPSYKIVRGSKSNCQYVSPYTYICDATSFIYDLKSLYSNYNPNNGMCLSPQIETSTQLFSCDPATGEPTYLPNPDPLGGPRCRDLFQKDGIAYTCNPNTNEATPIPNSDGTTTDPEDGGNIPNCNEGYDWSVTPSITVGGTGESYNSYSCKAVIPDGSTPVIGDNGVIVYPDGSIETPNGDGSKTRVYMDGSTVTTHSNGTTTSTPPTTGGDTGGTSGTGSTTGGTSGTGTTGGTTGTDTGSGSTGGGSGTTDTGGTTGGTSGTGTTGGDTGGTSGTGSTGGVTGTETGGTGTTGGDTGGTGTDSGTGTTPTTGTGVDDCNDSGLTLEQKQLCISNSKLTTANARLGSIDTSLGSIKNSLTPPADNGKSIVDGLDSYISDGNNFTDLKEATPEVTSFLSNKFSEYSLSLKNQLLALYDTFFNINTTGLPPIGVPYNFNAFGHNFHGAFLDQKMFNELGLDKLSIIVIFYFSMMGFIHAFRFLISSSTPIKDK